MKLLFTIFIIFCNINLISKWKEINYPKEIASFEAFVEDDKYLYGIDEDRIYRSGDNGINFEILKTNLNDFEGVGSFRELHHFENKLYLLTNGFDTYNHKAQLFCSEDFGITWKLININENNIRNLKIIENRFFVYNVSEFGMMYSNDYGENWDFLKDGDEILHYHQITASGDTLILAYQTADFTNAVGKGVAVSYDNGITWNYRSNGLNDEGINSIIKVGNILLAATRFGVYSSTNMGNFWIKQSSDLIGQKARVRFLDHHEGIIFAGTIEGVFVSYDTSKTWKSLNEIYDTSIIQYLNIENNKLYISANSSSKRCSKIYNFKNEEITIMNYNKGFRLLQLLIDNSIYAPSRRNGLLYSKSFDDEFENISEFFEEYIAPQRLLTKKENVLVAQLGGNSSIYEDYNNIIISEDYGFSWRFIELDSSKDYKFIDIFINSKKRIYLFTDLGVIYSDDLGNSWKEIATNDELINFNLNRLTGYLYQDDTLYLYGGSSSSRFFYKSDENFSFIEDNLIGEIGVYNSSLRNLVKKDNYYLGFNQNINMVVQSYDYGETWVQASALNRSNPNHLVFDIMRIEDNFFICTRFGIYYSTDLGQNWQDITYDLGFSIISGYLRLSHSYNYNSNKIYLTTSNSLFELDLLNDLDIKLSTFKKSDAVEQLIPYPQPSNSFVKIRIKSDMSLSFLIENVKIFNVKGEKIDITNSIYIEKETEKDRIIIWDNSKVEPGIYLMYLDNVKETKMTKIMITR
jgi:photosystem II stability/assembly factor-like uncharacterized protein